MEINFKSSVCFEVRQDGVDGPGEGPRPGASVRSRSSLAGRTKRKKRETGKHGRGVEAERGNGVIRFQR